MRSLLIKHLSLTIDKKCLKEFCCLPVFMRQDNALPHISGNNVISKLLRLQKWLTIKLVNQPAQLSDMNVNNLSLLWAHNLSLKKDCCKNAEGLIKAASDA